MDVYEKTDFEAYKNKENICPKNNIAQLYLIKGESNLHGNFPSFPKDGSDIHRFSNRKWVTMMCCAGNL